MNRQDARDDPTPQPANKAAQDELMWVCWRAADSIRANVRPYDERDAALREAGARLAYVTTGIRAEVLAKSQGDKPEARSRPVPRESLPDGALRAPYRWVGF
jgi:hypothetical protein